MAACHLVHTAVVARVPQNAQSHASDQSRVANSSTQSRVVTTLVRPTFETRRLSLSLNSKNGQNCRRHLPCRPVAALAADADSDDVPPPGCSRISVELSRPLGMVLEESKEGGIFVAEVVEGGKAAETGLVDIGDEVIATSAVVYNNTDSYGGVLVRKGMQVVRIATRGEKFDTIMAAIGSHPSSMKVKIELQKCKPVALGSS